MHAAHGAGDRDACVRLAKHRPGAVYKTTSSALECALKIGMTNVNNYDREVPARNVMLLVRHIPVLTASDESKQAEVARVL